MGKSRSGDQTKLPGSPWRFYAITLGFTWAVWIPLVAYTNQLGDVTQMELPPWQGIVLLLILQIGAYGPSLTAIALSLKRSGGSGLRPLFAQLTRWRVGPAWYAFALLIPALIQGAGLWLFVLVGGDVGGFEISRWPAMISGFLLILLFGPMAEELGWRGYALPRLVARMPAWQAAIVMGLLASLWHVPLFFSTFPPMSGFTLFEPLFLAYLAYAVSRCFLYTWLYLNTRSVLLCVLFHAAGNVAFPLVFFTDVSGVERSAIVLVSAIPQWLVAGYLIWRSSGNLTKQDP